MPGLSFLLKKRFHPGRIDNQEKVWVTENNAMIKKQKNIELAMDLLKEKEMIRYEEMMAKEGGAVDARQTSLSFMYSIPQPKGSKNKHEDSLKQGSSALTLTSVEDDDMVKLFKQKFSKQPSATSNSRKLGCEEAQDVISDETGLPGEKQIIKNRKDISQKERFPFLKNAPVEGVLAQTTNEIRHKPFNHVIHNVQCMRCGQWGHRSGERDCVLKDSNPYDYIRQQREDPLQHMNNDDELDDDDIDDDAESKFIASLTEREKKLLIKKLKAKIVLDSR